MFSKKTVMVTRKNTYTINILKLFAGELKEFYYYQSDITTDEFCTLGLQNPLLLFVFNNELLFVTKTLANYEPKT